MQVLDPGNSGKPSNERTKNPDTKKPAQRTAKRRGELAEVAFMYKAASIGFGVAKPYGDSDEYDFILDSGLRLWRVQVKSTYARGEGKQRGYQIQACHGSGQGKGRAYTLEEIDFLVAWIAVLDAWYVIPVRAFAPRKSLRLHPEENDRRVGFERFRGAWCRMACGQECEFRDGLEVERKCDISEYVAKVLEKTGGCPLRKLETDPHERELAGLCPGEYGGRRTYN